MNTWQSFFLMLAVFSLSSVSASGTFDIDDDGELDALTDGLLILRHLFGFSGSTLTEGAVARCYSAVSYTHLTLPTKA